MKFVRHITPALLLMGACAHYKVGADAATEVVVQTVAVPADLDVDSTLLTNLLVDRLNARGIAAKWGNHAALKCAVHATDVDGVGTAAAPTAHLQCEIGHESVEQFSTSAAAVGPEYRINTRSRLVTEASQNAIINAMPRIEAAIRRTYGQR